MTDAPEERLSETVLFVLGRLMTADEGLRPGIPHDAVGDVSGGAAHYLDRYTLELSRTPYAPSVDVLGAVTGTVEFATNEIIGLVDEVRVVLITGPFDAGALGAQILAGAAEVGVTLTADDDDANTWWEPEFNGRDLWVALGDGVVVLEGSRTDF